MVDHGREALPEQSGPSSCRVREDLDVIGIAPTGSGKTMAFLLPLLADGLCTSKKTVARIGALFDVFNELFPLSFDRSVPNNAALFARCHKMHAAGDAGLPAVLALVAAKGAASKRAAAAAAAPGDGNDDASLAQRWKVFGSECGLVDIVRPSALVLLPTRELALQVREVAVALGAASSAVIGGMEPGRQADQVQAEEPALLVATPGRLRAFCGEVPSSTQKRAANGGSEVPCERPRRVVDLSGVVRLVLDEGDRLLEEGFSEDINALVGMCKARRQSMLFSATWSPETQSLASMLRAETVQFVVGGIPGTIEQRVEIVPKVSRGRRLREILRAFDKDKAIVFVLFKQEAKELARMLVKEGFDAGALQGDMSQTARTAALQRFRESHAGILVATDVAARGLDVGGVKYVVNFSLGLSIDSYVHRIGRCGRAGRAGVAVTFVTDGDERHADPLVRLLQQAGQGVPPALREMASDFARNGRCRVASLHSASKPSRAEQKRQAVEARRVAAALPEGVSSRS